VPRFAAIDVGSNALRLRIVDVRDVGVEKDAPVEFSEVLSQRVALRLGTDVFLTQNLSAASIAQASHALRDFRRAMDAANVDGYRATATSAVRDAKNGALLVERAAREAGVDLEIIEGVEEARLVRLAVVRRIALDDVTALLIDVGGGSCEFTVLERGAHVVSLSLPLGSVRLLESHLKDAPTVDKKRLRLLDESVDRGLAELATRLEGRTIDVLVGTGGNVDTLADHCPAARSVPEARVIDVSSMNALVQKLCAMTTTERQAAYNLRADRADTIIPASRVFLRAAMTHGVAEMSAPGVGLKEGILLELVDRHFHTWHDTHETEGVLDACLRLGRRFRFDEGHGLLVSRFAAEIFDATQALHGLDERARLLLRAASVLHDIGDFLRYEGHHKHSFYIIQNADLLALSPRERGLVANIARYHRKSVPDTEHPNFRDLDREDRAAVRSLAGILRVADALDREHRGNVAEISPQVAEGRLFLGLQGPGDRALEEWTARSKSDLLRDALGLELDFAFAPAHKIDTQARKR
jgi:exopolyphosphatase / guanosine-5'-triphosphate,3'-diphosphate pyrophosphatase